MTMRAYLGGLLGLAMTLGACSGDEPADGEAPNGPSGSSSGMSSGGSSGSSSGGSSGGGSSSGSSGGEDDPNCHATPQPDDALRFMVAARPYAEGTQSAKRFSVMSLAADGAVAQLTDFELDGFQHFGAVAFSPDGRVGAVALDSSEQGKRGGVGVFLLDDDGQPSVVHGNLKGPFFADGVAFSGDGRTLYVTDANTVENGGGLYAAKIACDGTVGEFQRAVQSSGTQVPVWRPGAAAKASAMLGAFAIPDAPSGSALHLVDFAGTAATRTGSGLVHSERVLLAPGAWSPDGDFYLAAAPNDMLGGQKLFATKVSGTTLSDVGSFDLAGAGLVFASPHGNAFLAVTADPDNVYSIAFSKDGAVAGEPAGTHFGAPKAVSLTRRPQLAMAGAMIERGALKGRVVLAEVTAVRQLQFEGDGSVTDAARLEFGDGVEHILGAFGVTP